MALLEGENNPKRRLKILSNVPAESKYAELEITTNYVMFGEDIDIVAYKTIDDDGVEAFLVKETDAPPAYPNGLTSSNEIPPIIETLLESSSSLEDLHSTTKKDLSFVAQLLQPLRLLTPFYLHRTLSWHRYSRGLLSQASGALSVGSSTSLITASFPTLPAGPPTSFLPLLSVPWY